MERQMRDQARLFEGLGIPWRKMHPELPQTVVITNLTRDPSYLEIIYDFEQLMEVPMGRSLLCL